MRVFRIKWKKFLQKQPSRGVFIKRCSGNMQQIYRRTPIPKCDSNKVAGWNHTSARVFSCKFAAYFQNIFLLRTPLNDCFCFYFSDTRQFLFKVKCISQKVAFNLFYGKIKKSLLTFSFSFPDLRIVFHVSNKNSLIYFLMTHFKFR